jgi:methylmalonyl-CoA/ethylmalonyl-CoA epimerase
MQFHHVGCAVDSIEDYLRLYRDALGFIKVSSIIPIKSQKVQVCFVEVGNGSYIELIEATAPDSPIEKFKRVGYYHLCFLVEDLDQTIEFLKSQNFLFISLFSSEAFGDRRCSFLLNPFGHLIELAEAPPPLV